MVYCVINSNRDIIGRFNTERRAKEFALEYWFSNSAERLVIKKMTIEEYKEYTRKLIEECKVEIELTSM